MAPVAFTRKASIRAQIRSGTAAGQVGGCLALAQACGFIRIPSSTGAMLMTLTLIANSLSQRAFKALGIEEIAYVKPIVEGIGLTYAIHAADGTRLAVVEDRLVAFAMIRRNDLEPASLH
jgi:hypothetical protein